MVSLARNARTGDTAEKHRLLNHQKMPQFHRYDMDTKIDLSKLIFWGETIITWIVISAIFTALGLVIGWLVSQLIFCARMVITDLIGAMLFGAVVGAFVGFGQHSRMNARINLPHRWFYANIIGWGIAFLLLEFYVPIARCTISSNAPVYSNSWASNSYRLFSLIADQIEKLLYGEVLSGETRQLITYIMHTSMMGFILGFPQGIAQWLALRKHFLRSPIMVISNILGWIIGINGGLYIGSVQKWVFLGIIWALILPSAIIAWPPVKLKPRRVD